MSGVRRPAAADVVAGHEAVQLLAPPLAVALAHLLADGVGQACKGWPEVGLLGVVGLQLWDQGIELGKLCLELVAGRVHTASLRPTGLASLGRHLFHQLNGPMAGPGRERPFVKVDPTEFRQGRCRQLVP